MFKLTHLLLVLGLIATVMAEMPSDTPVADMLQMIPSCSVSLPDLHGMTLLLLFWLPLPWSLSLTRLTGPLRAEPPVSRGRMSFDQCRRIVELRLYKRHHPSTTIDLRAEIMSVFRSSS